MNLETFLVNFVASFLGSSAAIIVTVFLYRRSQKALEKLKRSMWYQFDKLRKEKT